MQNAEAKSTKARKVVSSWTNVQRRLLEDLYTSTDGKTLEEVVAQLASVLPSFEREDILYQANRQQRELSEIASFPSLLCERFIRTLEGVRGSREVELEIENARLKALLQKHQSDDEPKTEYATTAGKQVYARCKETAEKLQWEGKDEMFFVNLVGRWSGCDHLKNQLSGAKAAEAIIRMNLVHDAITNRDIRSKSGLEAVFLGPISKLEAV